MTPEDLLLFEDLPTMRARLAGNEDWGAGHGEGGGSG